MNIRIFSSHTRNHEHTYKYAHKYSPYRISFIGTDKWAYIATGYMFTAWNYFNFNFIVAIDSKSYEGLY